MTVTSTNSCNPQTASTTYSISVDPLPTASGGNSQTICSNGTATVSGVSSSNGSISWSHNGLGVLSNTTTLTPDYAAAVGDANSVVTLTMTVTSTNSCNPQTASTTYSISVDPLPTASGGNSQTICSNGTATVSGVSSSNGSISWSHNGLGVLSNTTTLTPDYAAAVGDANSVVTLTMTVTSTNSCNPQTASTTYSISVDPLPTASGGNSQTICSNGTATVSGVSSSNGSISWSHNGLGVLSNTTTLTPDYAAAVGDANSVVTLTMTVTSTNSCNPQTASTTYSISVDPLPTASGGNSQTICSNGTATVSGVSSSNGSISWSHNGLGVLSNTTTLTPDYAAAVGDANSVVTLTMTVTSTNSCNPQTASTTYSISVDPLPTASGGNSQTICSNGTATVSGVSSSNGSISWSHNGLGVLSNTTTLTPDYAAAVGDANSVVTLTMTVTSTNSCNPQTASTTYSISVDPLPTASGGEQSNDMQ